MRKTCFVCLTFSSLSSYFLRVQAALASYVGRRASAYYSGRFNCCSFNDICTRLKRLTRQNDDEDNFRMGAVTAPTRKRQLDNVVLFCVLSPLLSRGGSVRDLLRTRMTYGSRSAGYAGCCRRCVCSFFIHLLAQRQGILEKIESSQTMFGSRK